MSRSSIVLRCNTSTWHSDTKRFGFVSYCHFLVFAKGHCRTFLLLLSKLRLNWNHCHIYSQLKHLSTAGLTATHQPSSHTLLSWTLTWWCHTLVALLASPGKQIVKESKTNETNHASSWGLLLLSLGRNYSHCVHLCGDVCTRMKYCLGVGLKVKCRCVSVQIKHWSGCRSVCRGYGVRLYRCKR